ncbi:MAG: hypothetical protein QOJ42_328, partial [Acidobacteriaceae bacterium]|nr:hypothetical protein [Acidobacteriaceae bacterium]
LVARFFRILLFTTEALALLAGLGSATLLLTRFYRRSLARSVLVRHVISFHGKHGYQQPGLSGVPAKGKSNYDNPPLFGNGEDIFASAVS